MHAQLSAILDASSRGGAPTNRGYTRSKPLKTFNVVIVVPRQCLLIGRSSAQHCYYGLADRGTRDVT